MPTGEAPTPYVEHGAVISGVSAHVLAKILDSPNVRRVVDNLPPRMRAELDSTRRAIRRAAAAYEALPISAEGSAKTPVAEVGPFSPHEITTCEASVLLGVTERRCRQLASGGMGRLSGGRWLLSRSAVLAYAEQRRRPA